MSKYAYPAIFTEDKDDGGYVVCFPDVAGCYTQGKDIVEALEMAEDALNLMIMSAEDDGKTISPPSDIRSLSLKDNEFASMVRCDTDEYRKLLDELKRKR